ncbi:MAG: ABC transporter substrate-binding protein [Gemmatimonadales bacterium]
MTILRRCRRLAPLVVAASLLACRADAPVPATEALDTVRVANATGLSQAPMSLAAEEGYFREAGIVVEFVPVRQHEDVLVALLTDKLDAAVELFQAGYFGAMARGGALRFITSTVTLTPGHCPYVGVVLRPGLAPAEAARGLHKLRVSNDGMFRYLLSRDLESQGLHLASFELIRLQAELAEQALVKGTFDGAILAEPFLSRAARSGTFWMPSQAATPNVEIGGLLVGNALLTTRRDVGIRFLAAYRRGVATFNEGKTPANFAAMQRATGLDSTTLAGACWPAFRADGRLNLDGVMAYQSWLVKQGLADVTATPAQFWDSTLVAATDTILRHTPPRTPQ